MENSAIKKVFVLGGGAVGSVIAAALSHNPDIQIKLIGRKHHVEAIKKNGLKISGEMEKVYHFSCDQTIHSLLDDTLVILATKATDLGCSLEEISPYIRPSTLFLALQNGLGISDIILKNDKLNITGNRLYRGIVGFGATLLEPGFIRFFGGKLTVEELFSDTPYGNIFSNTTIKFHTTSDIKKRIWQKVIINSIYNPLSVLLKTDNKSISLEELDPIKQCLLDEGQAVAISEGIDPEINLSQINKVISSGNITSMLQDHLKGKESEIDFINGAITKTGIKNHIPTPINQFVTHMIKSIEYIRHNHLEFSSPGSNR